MFGRTGKPDQSQQRADASGQIPPQPASSSASGPGASGGTFSVAAPALNLPKGGGAIRGIGEKFAANPVTGTGSMSVPIYASSGRSGFGPQLALSYDSGASNGPFGLGWNLALPCITRKTDKGLPTYDDRAESDVFILSGAEDLVPVLNAAGTALEARPPRSVAHTPYHIQRYRPRIEGLFAKIERWTNQSDPTEVFWRTISKDNITTWYGRTQESRIFDPDAPAHIFSWLICESYDDKGNVIVYRYKPEDSLGINLGTINLASAHERNRSPKSRSAQRYLKRVFYGNHAPYLPQLSETADWPRLPESAPLDANPPADPTPLHQLDASPNWCFELVFDYGEHNLHAPLPTDADTWDCRNDPFSIYRSTFEIRTYRLCQRVLMFHHFAGEPEVETNCLVRSTNFAYAYELNSSTAKDPIFSLLLEVTQTGYQRDGQGGYHSRSLPPLRFEYSAAEIDQTIKQVDRESLENLPYGLDGAHYQWVDLDGEGLSGVLTEQGGALIYKRNLSPISNATIPGDSAQDRDTAGIRAKFGASERVAHQPALVSNSGARYQLLDLAGDGQLDLVDLQGAVPGFYERTSDEGWETFTAFSAAPVLDWSDPNLKFIDLTGDGHADILISQNEAFCWHASLAEAGFGPAQYARRLFDEEQGPAVVFADSTESIVLADFSGDGLSDIVRIRNGEVCYWPNLGYGRFGAKVTMDNAPWFEAPDLFDGRRIRLADIDGSGLTDIIYLAGSGVQLYHNQAGNSWSAGSTLNEFPRVNNLDTVVALDLLGNGTACLAWSSPLPGDAHQAMQYIDLMGGQKPHLLTKVFNNLGAETTVEYAPSTEFYLRDKLVGKPWITRLPFPVHCVKRVSVYDKWRKATFTTTYSYHHGYYDGVEREFRGFGRVEQVDSESYATFSADNSGSTHITDDQTLYQPPAKTVTWFHTGAFLDQQRVLSHYRNEYWPNWFAAQRLGTSDGLSDFQENLLPEPDFADTDLSPDEWREALRACKGMPLRQEIYELEVVALQRGDEIPVKLFSTAYHSCHIDRLQRQGINQHAVFLVTESEAITYHYELDLRNNQLQPDPRVAHTLNVRIDEFGHVLQSIAVTYPRFKTSLDSTLPAAAQPLAADVQQERHLAYTETCFTQDLREQDYPDTNRMRLPCEVQTYELTGIGPEDAEDRTTPDRRDNRYFAIDELRAFRLSERYQPADQYPDLTAVEPLAYHERASGGPQKRLVEHVRTLYFDDAGDTAPPTDPLPFGQHGPRGLKYEDYKLALTDDLLDAVFQRHDAHGLDALLAHELEPGATARSKLDEPRAPGSAYLKSGYILGTAIDASLAGQYWMRSGIAGFSAASFFLPDRYFDPFDNVTTLQYDSRLLFVKASTDALGNTTEIAAFDFRVLAPREMMDANANRTEAVFDILGRVAAVAIKGKGAEADDLGGYSADVANPDLPTVLNLLELPPLAPEAIRQRFSPMLGSATTRFLYHFGEEIQNGATVWAARPAGACAIQREIHASQPGGAASPLQLALECSDGAGNVLMKKVQAEPDPELARTDPNAPLRWIVNGLTVLNNKGKPVKQYEPAFSATFGCELPQANGVTPILYYDAPGRLIRTEYPDGTLSRVEFSPWYITTFDQNDTVLESRWYADRNLLSLTQTPPSDADQRAAWLAAKHANTPALTVLDSLGREVVAIAHNRTPDANNLPQDDFYVTYTKLDAEGKPLWIRDARGNLVMQYITPPKPNHDPANTIPANAVPCYDIAGNQLFQHSMDAGQRWMLTDAAGKPMIAWDFNQRQQADNTFFDERRLFFTEYDALHRPTAQWLRMNDDPPQMVERFEYRDTRQPDGTPNPNVAADQAANLIGQAVFHYDPSGRVELVKRDFNGNVVDIARRLNNQPTESIVNWAADPQNFLEAETFVQHTEYDALNRMVRLENWHRQGDAGAVYIPTYSERGLLTRETLTIRGSTTTAIQAIKYNAKGQKEFLQLGNNTLTQYEYDPTTFRLKQIRTTRPTDPANFPALRSNLSNPKIVQQLLYTYDPVGNITEVEDQAYKPVFFDNGIAEPKSLYTYDALYRLIEASGREAAVGGDAAREAKEPAYGNGFPITDQTLRRYTERYAYDPVGNITTLQHTVIGDTAHSWTRHYTYACDNPAQLPASNRLWQTWMGDDLLHATTYQHDTHGNMLNLANTDPGFYMRWDHRDMIAGIDLGGGGTAYYQYDAGKQRTRKRIVNQNGLGGYWERIYLGGYELYRRRNAQGAVLEEIETHHLFEGEQRVLLVDDVLVTSSTVQTLFRYQYSNHLGSVCLELDAQAGIISYEEYHPYGTSAYRALKSAIEAPPKRYRYTGMERDEESGLNYHTARYYAPWLGRWVSCDPVGLTDGGNLYCYCANNSIDSVDPTGGYGESASLLNDVPDTEPKTFLNPENHGGALLNDRLVPSEDDPNADVLYHESDSTHDKVSDIEFSGAEVTGRTSTQSMFETWSKAKESSHDLSYYWGALGESGLRQRAINEGNVAGAKAAGTFYTIALAGVAGGYLGAWGGAYFAAWFELGTVGTGLSATVGSGLYASFFSQTAAIALGTQQEYSKLQFGVDVGLAVASATVAGFQHWYTFPSESTWLAGQPGFFGKGRYGWQYVVKDAGGPITRPVGEKQFDQPARAGLHRAHLHGYSLGGGDTTAYSTPRLNTSWMKVFENAARKFGGSLYAEALRGGGRTSFSWTAYTPHGEFALGIANLQEPVANVPRFRSVFNRKYQVGPGVRIFFGNN